MSDRLNSEKELKKRFGLRILGVFSQAPRKRAFAGVDGWLNRMEGKRLRHPAEVYEIMAVNVRNYMQTGKKILILGSASNLSLIPIFSAYNRFWKEPMGALLSYFNCT